MTADQVYEWLIAERIREPACLVLGTNHIIGRWEDAANVEPNGYICRAGRLAIVVLGEGDDWTAAYKAARARLNPYLRACAK